MRIPGSEGLFLKLSNLAEAHTRFLQHSRRLRGQLHQLIVRLYYRYSYKARSYRWSLLLYKLPKILGYFSVCASLSVLFLMYCVGAYTCFVLARKTFSPNWDQIVDVEAAKAFFPTLIAVIGGPFLVWRVITSHMQAVASGQQATAAKHQADTGREAHFTTLFTKAVEQLGTTRDEINAEGLVRTMPNLEVRLGAIYALERIAQDSERDFWPIMEVLSAYVRNRQNSGDPILQPAGLLDSDKTLKKWIESLPPPRVDIQAIITVIGRRSTKQLARQEDDIRFVDFSNSNLQRVNFTFGDFTYIALWSSYLEGADFEASNFIDVGLDGAFLTGASISNAMLQQATLIDTHLEGANLYLTDFSGSDMRGAHFERARLEAAGFDHAHMEGAVLDGAQLFRTNLSNARGLVSSSVEKALGDASTKLPANVKRPKHWPKKRT
jgi:hypothetical protein